ncbi:MAG TPA: D-alanyl-D-alanine carboxypeptidase family protein [Solirubrobacter sp.]|nr:D-alanyl-D-alanine carboxypeptidase family protein [Solirubrobacter sp.]
MQAAQAVGLAQGGIYSQGEIEDLWVAAKGPESQRRIAGAVGMAESGGDTHAVGPATPWGRAKGLMQILGQVVPGDLFDPLVNMRNAVKKWQDAGGWSPWEAFTGPDGVGSDGPYLKFLNGGGGGGILGKIGSAISGAASGVADMVKGLVGKLPGPDGLGWLKGTGKYVLGKVKDWIKGKIGGLFSGGGESGGGGGATVTGLVPAVKRALEFARGHGWQGTVTSGFRTYEQQAALYQAYLDGTGNLAARPGTSNHEKGIAIDVTDTEAFAAAMRAMGAGALMRKVPGEPWHFSTTGYARGGVFGGLPFLGTYHGGGVAPREGLAHVAAGERMTPAGRGDSPLVYIAEYHSHGDADDERIARKLAFRLN